MTTRSHRLALLVTAVAALATCALPAAAQSKDDKKVTIDWWLPTGDPATQAAVGVAFKAITGNTVKPYQDTNAPLVQKIYAAFQRNESPDVIYITNPSDIDAFVKAKMLLSYTPGPVEKDYPKELKSYAPFAYPYALITYGVAYNAKAIPPEKGNFATFADMLNPAYKGKFGMPDPAVVGGMVSALFAMRQHMGETNYEAFLKALAVLKPKFYTSNYPLGNAIASGELSLGLIFDQAANAQVRLGAPVAFAYPSGAPAAYGLAAIPANAKNIAAAKQFLDFVTSSEGQQLWSNTYGDTPANPLAVPLVQKDMSGKPWYRTPGALAYLTATPTVEQQKALVKQFNEIVKGT
jgi:iron(III) transport system substrate-binding protein